MSEENLNSTLWEKLTELQKQELLLAYDESLDQNNFISHDQIKPACKY